MPIDPKQKQFKPTYIDCFSIPKQPDQVQCNGCGEWYEFPGPENDPAYVSTKCKVCKTIINGG